MIALVFFFLLTIPGPPRGVPSLMSGLVMPSRVLIVEDNQDCAETLRILVRCWGHEARVAHDGEAGLIEANAFLPNVLLLDLGLPKLDGFELGRRVRQTPGLENALLIAITGYDQDEDRRRTSEAGFDHHFVKPCDPEVLERLLASSA